MSEDKRELLQICEQLSDDQCVEVVDFARFLLARSNDDRWEQIITDSKPRPKLDDFLSNSRNEGSETLDIGQL